MENKGLVKNKCLYKCFDIISQKWYYTHAFSLAQANVLLRNQMLAVNGRYNYTQLQKVIK